MINNRPGRLLALVSTIEPIDGGVPTMTRWICQKLEEFSITPILAWYAPWRNYPDMSVPSYKLLSRSKPNIIQQVAFERFDSYGIGCWFPELEFTHYLPTGLWKHLIQKSHLHLSVSGNVLCSLPYLKHQVPFLSWVATPWQADRRDRIREFIFPRRLLDTTVNTPILKYLEKRILRASFGEILCLSKYTLEELSLLSKNSLANVLYMPVNTNLFRPDYSKTKKWKIGFSGRYCDPRKNIELLLGAIKLLYEQGREIELVLVGERKADQLSPLINQFGLTSIVTCYMHLAPNDLASLLQTLDVFAIPSHQEGLCIAALEAMACGVPVVSTRCGGPEDYVKSGITGELVDKNPNSLASAIFNLCSNREKRHRLSLASEKWVTENASEDASRQKFHTQLVSYAKRKGYTID